MGKDDNGWWPFLQELLKTEIYKRSQGRIVRQVTCVVIWVVFALAAWQIYAYMKVEWSSLPGALRYVLSFVLPSTWVEWSSLPGALRYVVSFIVLALGLWLGYRVVNLPSFADFLIAVEAEMNKVSWPSQTELVRSSLVVIILMFGLTVVLFFYDMALVWLLRDVLHVVS